MEMAGLKVKYFSELKPTFQQSHLMNFKDSVLIGGDIIKISDETFLKLKGKIKIMFGGFPCQSFSHGGKKDPTDPRGQLYLQFVRATRLVEPEFIIGENVKGLLTRKTNNGNMFIDEIVREFKNIGYTCHYKIIKALECGVPQSRERLIIIGKKGEWTPKWPSPMAQKNLRDILSSSMEGSVEVPKELLDEAGVPTESLIQGEGEPTGTPHPYLIDRANVRGVEYKDKTYGTYAFSFGKRKSPVHCEIINPDSISKTIICTYGHQPRLFVAMIFEKRYFLRCLTVDEIKMIQGFPKEYKLSGNLKDQIVQLGNAVPPPIVEAVCRELLNSN